VAVGTVPVGVGVGLGVLDPARVIGVIETVFQPAPLTMALPN
jgi:hypothetical protein